MHLYSTHYQLQLIRWYLRNNDNNEYKNNHKFNRSNINNININPKNYIVPLAEKNHPLNPLRSSTLLLKVFEIFKLPSGVSTQ